MKQISYYAQNEINGSIVRIEGTLYFILVGQKFLCIFL